MRTSILLLLLAVAAPLFAQTDSLLDCRDLHACYEVLATRRAEQIERLHSYAMRGEFPRNVDFPNQSIPYFVDHRGTPCAVADLMLKSGQSCAVKSISSANNHVRIMDATSGPLADWALESGLLQEECALIQPEYGFAEQDHANLMEDEYKHIQLHLIAVEEKLTHDADISLQAALLRLVKKKIDTGKLTIEHLPALKDALNDPEPKVVIGACYALGKLPIPLDKAEEVLPLLQAHQNDTGLPAKLWCAGTYERLSRRPESNWTLPIYREALKSSDTNLRLMTLEFLNHSQENFWMSRVESDHSRQWIEKIILLRQARTDADADIRFYSGYTLYRAMNPRSKMQKCDDPGLDVLFDAPEAQKFHGGGKPQQIFEAVHARDLDKIRELIKANPVCLHAMTSIGSVPLHLAVEEGSTDVVALLLEVGSDPDVKNDFFHTPLVAAAANGSLDLVKIFFERSKNRRDLIPAMEWAAWYGHLETVKYLLEKGGDPAGALHRAVMIGYPDIVKLLLEHTDLSKVDNGLSESLLEIAASMGHTEIAKILIEHGADVNGKPERKWTSLHSAAMSGAADAAKFLLEQKANPLALNFAGCTPFEVAVRSGQIETLKVLIKFVPDINQKDQSVDGRTPLNVAATLVAPDTAAFLLANGADVNSRDMYENSSLHIAASLGRIEMVRVLLDNKADIEAENKFGDRPLNGAVANGHKNVAQLLLDRGANINGKKPECSPLRCALSNRRLDLMKFLIERGASPAANLGTLSTPMHMAAACADDTEPLQFLLDHGADATARDGNGATLLHLAVGHGNVNVIQFLLDHGADINAADDSKRTPVSIAASLGKTEAVELLFEKKAKAAGASYYSDGTPLWVAAKEGYTKIVQLLLKNGAAPNAQNPSDLNRTPLHVAVGRDLAIVKELLSQLADVNATDDHGDTPLHVAVESRSTSILQALLEAGADRSIKNKNSETPEDRARSRNDRETANFLKHWKLKKREDE